MKGSWVLNRIKNRIKDRIVRHFSRSDEPHSEPYRFIRANLSRISMQEKEALFLELKKELAGSSETTAYAETIFFTYFNHYRRHAESLDGTRILEIGPGNNLGAGIYFLLAGTGQYVAIDALAAFPERPGEYYRNLLEEVRAKPHLVGQTNIPQEAIHQIIQFGPKGIQWNQERIQYLTPVCAEKMPFREEQFDYVFSNASFEHFEQPDLVIREVYRVLKPGGLTTHTIDLRDHADFNKPRRFLTVSMDDYRFASPYQTNRWRSSDFEKGFRAAGFRSLQIKIEAKQEISDEEYAGYDPYFREHYSRDDLEILGIAVLAVK